MIQAIITRLMNALGRWFVPALILLAVWACLAIYVVTWVLDGSFFAGILVALLAVPFGMAVNSMPRLRNRLLLVGALIFIVSFLAATGIIPRSVRNESSRLRENKVQGVANWMAKTSKMTEREAGIFADVTGSGKLYASPAGADFPGREIRVRSSQIIRVVTLNGKPLTEGGPEGMTQVMLKDDAGDFLSGQKGWYPTRKLRLKRDFAFLDGFFRKDEPQEPDPGIVHEVGLNDPKGTFIPLEDGTYRVWADNKTRIQYTDHLSGGILREVYPSGYFPDLGRKVVGNKMKPYNPVLEAPSWAVILKRDVSDQGVAFGDKSFIISVKRGVLVTINAPTVEVPNERFNPDLNWVYNKGTVRIHFLRLD